MNSRRAYVVYAAAALIYLIAVTQRTSLGVAGLDAQQRFAVSASILSTLAVVQIVVYAVMQIPVGILLDRLGPRLLLTCGATLMACGQILLALTQEFPLAVLGRILVGAGDAATFVSAMRVVYAWFKPRRSPLMAQWLGNAGQVGQILSALPFALLLREVGWTRAFIALGAIGAFAALVGIVVVRDGPRGSRALTAPRFDLVFRRLRIAVKSPGTWLGFWTHFITMMPAAVFSLLWGIPMLQAALGYSHALAASLLMLIVASALLFGPIVGAMTSRAPHVRTPIVAVTVFLGLASWIAMILWPGTPPLWFVVALILIIGIGGPVSMIGFEFGNAFNSSRSIGVVNGLVNMGGFTATFIVLFATGVVLDTVSDMDRASGGAGELYTLTGFRVAWVVQGIIVLAGFAMFAVARGRTRRRIARRGGIDALPAWLFDRDRWGRTKTR